MSDYDVSVQGHHLAQVAPDMIAHACNPSPQKADEGKITGNSRLTGVRSCVKYNYKKCTTLVRAILAERVKTI